MVSAEGIESGKETYFQVHTERQMTRKCIESILNRVNSTQTARARTREQQEEEEKLKRIPRDAPVDTAILRDLKQRIVAQQHSQDEP